MTQGTTRTRRAAVVFGLGFFALVAQTLLFRDFLTAFEGSELGVGSFFGSWLLWVALGAVAGRVASGRLPGLAERLELTAMLYLPAFLLQQSLIAHARELGGVSAYEVYPFGRMFIVGLIANAPISLTTGLLFTLACRWWEREQTLPPARVYIVETLGSFAGGIVATPLLAGGVAGESVFCMAAVVLVASAAITWIAAAKPQRPRATGTVLLALLVCLSALWLSGIAGWWSKRNDQSAWSRLLPPDEFRGSFTTAQAKYLYGQRQGQFVVMSWGGVSEALPNTEHASEAIALSLSQHPASRNVLVVGQGSLGICLRLRELPQIREVVWLHPDPQYPGALLSRVPPDLKTAAQRIVVPEAEVRDYLRMHPGRFDLVLLNLPDPTTLVLNRYWTREFIDLVKQSLTDGGVVCTRVTGAANFMGGELVYVGTSALATLQSVFGHVVLKPGDESWLIASDGESLTTAPAELRDRFAKIEGAAAVYPPEGLMSLYPPDRIQFQMDKYREAAADVEPAMLQNTDRRPKAMLFSLLWALRRTAFLSFARHVPILWAGGIWIAVCPIVIYGLLRLIYLLAPQGGRPTDESSVVATAFDGRALIFATGLAGMALSIVLMFLYQSRFGSLFLHIGLISSLFMFGSFVGSLVSERLVADGRRNGVARRWGFVEKTRSWIRKNSDGSRGHSLNSCEFSYKPIPAPVADVRGEQRWILPGCLLVNLVLIGAVMAVPQDAPRVVYAGLFAACGAFVGVYFPIAAHRLRAAGQSAAASGSSLEMLDHLGGAAGAIVSGWLLLPVLGAWLTLCVLALLVGVNLLPTVVRARSGYSPPGADGFDRLVRPAGYTLLGVAASVLAASHIVATVASQQAGQRAIQAALAMTGSSDLTTRHASLSDGTAFSYWEVPDSGEEDGGFVFGTEPFAEGISGYGGPVEMAVFVSRDGALRDLRIVRSHETPAYVESIGEWLETLPGRNVFDAADLAGVDAVSGATMTSAAILQTLQQAGPRFASAALGMEVRAAAPVRRHRLDLPFACLAVLLGLAVIVRRVPNVWVRRALLLATLVATGFWWNLQYSTQQVMAILSFNLPGNLLSGSFLLVLLVPTVVLLVGNVYCGYVCPFGALQELVGDLRPGRLDTDPPKKVWRYARAVKYLLLALLVVLFGLTRNSGVLSADPLLTVFSRHRDLSILCVAIGLVALSFVFRRFWCRNLCPAGAFLALLCRVRLLRRLTPRAEPARCDLGVRAAGELDCLCCDRCRHAKD